MCGQAYKVLRVMSAVSFRYVEHMLAVPAVAGEVPTTFIFDTGIGVSLISSGLAARAGCVPPGPGLHRAQDVRPAGHGAHEHAEFAQAG